MFLFYAIYPFYSLLMLGWGVSLFLSAEADAAEPRLAALQQAAALVIAALGCVLRPTHGVPLR